VTTTMSGGGGDGGASKVDPRISYMLRRMALLLGKSNAEKFNAAFLGDENTMKSATRFVDDPTVGRCFFFPNAESVTASTSDYPTPTQLKKKIVVLHRMQPDMELTKENMPTATIIFELSKGVMDLLSSYCYSVYLSTFSNPANQAGWSDLISKDLMDKYWVFLANLHVTVGLMKGNTLLPQPQKDALPNGSITNSAAANGNAGMGSKDRLHVLEGAVITWTKQIRHVLKQDPEMLLKKGKNPEPDAELQFWKNKAANLNSIHDQLGKEDLKKVLKFLELQRSTYVEPFSKLRKEVEEARDEANDNEDFLKTLTKGINALTSDSADFETLDKHFNGILHNVLLIWKHSKYYTTPARLAVLIREICNSIITQATKFISGPDVFNMIASDEAQDCHDKLERTLQVCTALKDIFEIYRKKSIDNGEGWKMKPEALFVRLDAFRERCRDALDFTRMVMQFSKLERIDIGGTKGKLLSELVVVILEEFNVAVERFKDVKYDIMDVGCKQFDHDFFTFRVAVKDLDRRLGSLLGSAFDDLDTIQARIKLFDNFEGLLERPIIQAELEKKHKMLLRQYQQDLNIVETMFNENREKVDGCFDDAPIFSNLPPVAGAIYWARSARNRISEPMAKLVLYNHALKEAPDEFKEVEKQHHNLLTLLEGYEKQRYSSWEATNVEMAKEKLKMKLLRRQDKTGLIKVNFDPALVRLLREVRFFLIFDIKVPSDANDIFNTSKTYREWIGQLDQIVQMYNSVLTELLPVEEPLLEDRISKMDQTLSPGLTELKWKSEERIPDFIAEAMRVVSDVSGVVDIMKGNLRNISGILAGWCKEPIIERKKGAKPMTMEEFDVKHKERLGARIYNMTDGGKEILKFVKDSNEALKVSKTASSWRAYVDFVNNIVIEGFVSSIAVSLQYLCEILDPLIIAKQEMLPLFDVRIQLQEPEIEFEPPFKHPKPSEQSLRRTISDWLKDFFTTITCMPRLDTLAGDYLNEIREHFQMQCLLALVSELIDNTELKCMEYRETFMQYSFLWTRNIDETFEAFLAEDAHDLVQGFEEEGMDFRSIMQRVKVDIGDPIPKLERFDKKIEEFTDMKNLLAGIKSPHEIHWLRIHAQPVKLSLVNYARRWEEKYTEYLKNYTEARIRGLVTFIEKLKTVLGPPSPADEPENERLLYETMIGIGHVKMARNALKLMFTPLRDLCQLLKKHHVSHWGLVELDQAPTVWGEVIRMAFDEKEKILPLQSHEQLKVRKKIDVFADEVASFRQEFLENCPFTSEFAESGDFAASYSVIEQYQQKTQGMKVRAADLNEQEMLFDISLSSHYGLSECGDDLQFLKQLWDGVVLVKETFTSWDKILWDKIDTEELVMTVRELEKKVKNMPKEVKTWKLYRWLTEEVKNMATLLPLMNDLHGETMRDRHWNQLMVVTEKTFEKGPDFCFKDLLDLQLHHFADDVSEIVDQS